MGLSIGDRGVIAFLVKGVLTLNADINVTGKGFNGGIASQGNGNCQRSDDTMTYESYTRSSSRAAGYKGEGIGFKNGDGYSLFTLISCAARERI
ncbi:MAG: hypothetical protein U5L72_07155 [Bacteroidales bacterium]|nr:hypothetical protein [Bacteroidales bacterium]